MEMGNAREVDGFGDLENGYNLINLDERPLFLEFF